jgi:hypothetical protein
MRYVDEYPLWYGFFKWVLPLTMASASGLWVFLTLTGAIPVPAVLSALQWAPTFYQSLHGLSAFSLVSLAMLKVSASIGLLVSGLARATILFNINETKAAQGLKAQEVIDEFSDKITDQTQQLNELYSKNIAREEENRDLKEEVLFLQKKLDKHKQKNDKPTTYLPDNLRHREPHHLYVPPYLHSFHHPYWEHAHAHSHYPHPQHFTEHPEYKPVNYPR